MLPIKQDLLSNSRNRPYLRNPRTYAIRRLKGVVAHWTANTDRGAHAQANRNYFNNTDRFASAHYIVDDHSIIQCVPDHEVAYHVGALRYKPDGERIRENDLSPNYFLVGFEMCVNRDGDWNKTYRNSVELAAFLLRKHHFTTFSLYRHYDITGKDCPKMMLEDSIWLKFKQDIEAEMARRFKAEPLQIGKGRVTYDYLNVRSGPGTSFPIVGKLIQNDIVRLRGEQNGWYYLGNSRWVSGNYIEVVFQTKLGRVSDQTGANVRLGPGLTHRLVDTLPYRGYLYITDQNGDWFETEVNRWVHDSVIDLIQPQPGEVIRTENLNVRCGPSTDYPVVRRIKRGEKVFISETDGEWYRIGDSEWVNGGYVEL